MLLLLSGCSAFKDKKSIAIQATAECEVMMPDGTRMYCAAGGQRLLDKAEPTGRVLR